jgi:hypothetical protein
VVNVKANPRRQKKADEADGDHDVARALGVDLEGFPPDAHESGVHLQKPPVVLAQTPNAVPRALRPLAAVPRGRDRRPKAIEIPFHVDHGSMKWLPRAATRLR